MRMSSTSAEQIDDLLARKRELARQGQATPELAARLHDLRSWQAARLARTYRDLHARPNFAPAVDFFLSELYGPGDLTRRDEDLIRAWRYLKRALPGAALKGLGSAMALEVLTIELDHAMVGALAPGTLNETHYADAYRAVGRREARQRQIDLAVGAGEQLDLLAARPLLGTLLRAAHGPAHAAGFGVLQDFLERGYEAFRSVGDPRALLETIRERETTLMNALFSGDVAPFAFIDRIRAHTHA
jgi:hypothetical protein